MSRTGPHRRAFSATSYVVVRGSRGRGGGGEGEGSAAGRAATDAGAGAEAGDRRAAALCCSRHTRSRRNRSRRANSTVVDFASAVFSDDDVSTHAAYSANSLAVAVVSSISVFWRLLGSSRTKGPVRASDLGRPTRFLVLSMTSSSLGGSVRSPAVGGAHREISGTSWIARLWSRSRETTTRRPSSRSTSGGLGISVNWRRASSTIRTNSRPDGAGSHMKTRPRKVDGSLTYVRPSCLASRWARSARSVAGSGARSCAASRGATWTGSTRSRWQSGRKPVSGEPLEPPDIRRNPVGGRGFAAVA
jgi:hypothetical protein